LLKLLGGSERADGELACPNLVYLAHRFSPSLTGITGGD
jgi:hypothetical protein